MIKPTDGFLLIEITTTTKTSAGISLPDMARDQVSQKGKVLAVGGTIKHKNFEEQPPCKKGDVIFLKKHTQHLVEDYKEEVRAFICFSDVLAVE